MDHPKWVAIMSGARELCDSRAEARALAKDAALTWTAAMIWGGRVNCDGVIPESAAATIAPRAFLTEDEFIDAAPLLVKAGLWHALSKSKRQRPSCACVMDSADLTQRPGWIIHDFADYQKAKQQVELAEDREARKRRLYRTKKGREILATVKARDMDHCRYCWIEVKWEARRGGRAGTIDHVDPAAPNSVGNCVVSCKSCNSRKGDRTPDEAEMSLLPPYFGVDDPADYHPPVSSRDLVATESRPNRAGGSGRVGSGQVGFGSGREAQPTDTPAVGSTADVVVRDVADVVPTDLIPHPALREDFSQ
jgi:5-methylcytosine-specific restriction endonuclease McrA